MKIYIKVMGWLIGIVSEESKYQSLFKESEFQNYVRCWSITKTNLSVKLWTCNHASAATLLSPVHTCVSVKCFSIPKHFQNYICKIAYSKYLYIWKGVC